MVGDTLNKFGKLGLQQNFNHFFVVNRVNIPRECYILCERDGGDKSILGNIGEFQILLSFNSARLWGVETKENVDQRRLSNS